MASAAVAAQLGEHGRNLVGEVDRLGRFGPLHFDGHFRGLGAVGRGDLGGAVRDREDPAVGIDAQDLRMADGVLRVSREVERLACVADTGDGELRGVVRTADGDFRGEGIELDDHRFRVGREKRRRQKPGEGQSAEGTHGRNPR